MSETVTSNAPNMGRQYEVPPKPARKSQPVQFPHRLSICFATDQIENLQQVKKAFRCSESFAIRMAFDTFCRTNGFPVNGNGGPHNGR
jgi:hypothetical protein